MKRNLESQNAPARILELVLVSFCWISIFLYMRRHSIFSLTVFNPDEAELIATGRRAGLSLIPYKEFTTSTLGPTWVYFLGLLNKLGLPMTMPVAHLLSALISCAVVIIIFFNVRWKWGTTSAIMLVGPLGLIWSSGNLPRNQSDVNALGTLQLPLLISFVAFTVFIHRKDKTLNHLIFGILLGLAILAKYQTGPLILAFGVLIIRKPELTLEDKRIWRRYGVFMVGLLTPVAILVLATVIYGTTDKLWFEGVGFLKDYIFNRQELTGQVSLSLSSKIANIVEFVFLYPGFLYPLIFSLVYSTVKSDERVKSGTGTNSILIILVVLLGSLSITNPLFPNYALLILFAAIFSLLILISLLDNQKTIQCRPARKKPSLVLLLPVLLGLLYSLPLINSSQKSELGMIDVFSQIGGQTSRFAEDGVNYLGRYCPPGSRVFVYGWSAELYSQNLWTPASRYVNSTWLLLGTTEKARYIEFLLDEFSKNTPDCVVEALGPGFFGSLGLDKSIRIEFPSLYNFLINTRFEIREGNFSGTSFVRIFTKENSS